MDRHPSHDLSGTSQIISHPPLESEHRPVGRAVPTKLSELTAPFFVVFHDARPGADGASRSLTVGQRGLDTHAVAESTRITLDRQLRAFRDDEVRAQPIPVATKVLAALKFVTRGRPPLAFLVTSTAAFLFSPRACLYGSAP